ncbi:hypothetical protein AVEN_10974-1 [Araneus ventricosus]|uniref:Uncharacterized protein n=1 Tax=Araneus ventricosus TaxID=182803 RepID=A0A4Y2JEB9_ARAVE|nr:hypothetical protein AVEN_10974-1 [Araneus ventricosus]
MARLCCEVRNRTFWKIPRISGTKLRRASRHRASQTSIWRQKCRQVPKSPLTVIAVRLTNMHNTNYTKFYRDQVAAHRHSALNAGFYIVDASIRSTAVSR